MDKPEEIQNELALALSAIRKKLVGKSLTYKETFAIMDTIAQKRLGDILTTYFAASGYSKGFSDEEIYYLTKAMVETGDKLKFPGIVADKHSIGGVPGTRTTLIVVPIVAAAGFMIPKSSSRAITTPGGTADDMEVIAPVTLTKEQIYKVVKETNGCIVWGGSVDMAPADDELIKVEAPLLFESYDKILVSIMAKKVAFGSTHVVIDLPWGKTVKLHRLEDARLLARKFEILAKKFHIKIKCLIHKTNEPVGQGIGPSLETRDALMVLEQTKDRPLDLEMRALHLAGTLLDLCLPDAPKQIQDMVEKNYKNGTGWATFLLHNGKAFDKMQEIVRAQGGKVPIRSTHIKPGIHTAAIHAHKNGTISEINSYNLTAIAKILGAPHHKGAGIYLHKKIGEHVKKDEILYTLYSENMYNLKEAKDTLPGVPIFTI